MTSSSSLYGPVNEQNTQSTNSTSLYGGADTPIPTPAGDVVVRGDLVVLSGNILTTATTGNIFPANATTVNLGNAATSVNIGADTGTTTINNNLVVDGSVEANSADFGNIQIAVVDGQTISTTAGELRLRSTSNAIKLPSVTSVYTDNTSTFGLLNQPTTVNAFLAATAVNIGADTGTTNINNDLLVEGVGTFTGDITGPGATLGNISVGITNNNTIGTTTGSLQLSATTGDIGLIGADTLYTDNTGTFNLLNAPTTIYAFDSATTLELGDTGGSGTTGINNNLRIDGTSVRLAQDTGFLYSENNDRTMRPYVQSTTGNSSGFRVKAPNATTSAAASLSVSNTNDAANTTFLSMQALGSATDPLRITTGKYTANVFGPSGNSIAVRDGTTTYATLNPAGPTIGTDLTTKTYVDAQIGTVPTYTTNVAPATGGVELDLQQIIGTGISVVGSTKFIGGTNVTVAETAPNEITITAPDINTTYTIDASATTGGANFNLVGSDATTDTIKIASGTGINVAQTNANTITVNSTITQYTDAQARSSISGTGNISYNSTTGVISTPLTQYTDAMARSSISATGDISYNPTTGVISYTAPTAPVTSVNGQTGVVVLDTDDVSEGTTNLYFQTARARDSISAGTGIAYNSTTGVIDSTIVQYTDADARASISGGAGISYNSTTGVIDSTITQYTDADARASISATGDISYNSTTGVISYTAPAAPVTSVNGQTGTVVLTTTDIAEGTNLYYTDARSRAALSGGTGISYNSTTGVIDNSGVTALAGSNHISVNASTGSITVSSDATNANTAGTIVARNGNGDFSAGTITANFTNGDRVLGAITATPSTTYTFQAPVLTTINDNNGLDAVSSYTGTLGNGAQQQITQYFGDTFAANLTSAALGLRTANGNSETTGTVPFTGLAPTATNASILNNTLGTINYAGYATTDFANYISTRNQGGGRQATHNLQIQGVANETYADGTLTISGATITAVSRVSVALASVSVTGTKGQISFTATTPGVGNAIVVTGTNSGTSTGITAGTYYITQTASTTTAQLSATPGGPPITTTAGTTTGLTFTRQFITVTYSAQTYIPFGLNALVTISGFNNVTSGTYMAVGTSTTTSINIGAPSSAVPTLSGSQSVSCPTVTNAGSSLRIRAMPLAKPMNTGNRVDIITHSPETATYKSDQYNFQGGSNTFNYLTANAAAVTAQGSFVVKDLTGATTYATVDVAKAAFTVPVGFPVKTAAQWRAITGAVGYQVCVSDSASGGNPNGMMAFWDTSNARWSYIHDNSAV